MTGTILVGLVLTGLLIEILRKRPGLQPVAKSGRRKAFAGRV